jgi:hypothetical protein
MIVGIKNYQILKKDIKDLG